MRVTIEGDMEQVFEVLGFTFETPTPRQSRIAENRTRREEFVARRKVVVDAFKITLRTGADREMVLLLEAIRRTEGVTDEDLKLARQVLAGSVSNGHHQGEAG